MDDNATLRELLVRGLRWEGFEACGAEDALHAIVLLDGFRPDLIVTDVQMPGMSGLEFAGIVRERDTATPVLVISGRDAESDKAAAFAAGADAYLVKPFGWAELLHRVQTLLGPAASAEMSPRGQERRSPFMTSPAIASADQTPAAPGSAAR